MLGRPCTWCAPARGGGCTHVQCDVWSLTLFDLSLLNGYPRSADVSEQTSPVGFATSPTGKRNLMYVCVHVGLLVCWPAAFARSVLHHVWPPRSSKTTTSYAPLVSPALWRNWAIASRKPRRQNRRPHPNCIAVCVCVCVRVCVNEYVCRVFCKVTHTHIRTGKLAPMNAHTLTQVRVHPRTHTHMHTLTCTGVRTHIRPYSTRNTHKNVDK